MDDIIVIRDLVKRFGDKTAIDHLDLEIHRGEVFGFLGPNGAGKTTTVRCIATLTNYDEGTIEVDGKDLVKDPTAAKDKMGVIQQQVSLDKDLTIRENMISHAMYHMIPKKERNARIEELSDYFGLDEYLDKPVDSLSGGWKKRAAIVCAVLHRPDVLFLDEPTSGLDINARRLLWDVVRNLNEKGTTIFLTTHYIEEAEALCDRVGIIDHGKIIALGDPKSLCEKVGSTAVEYMEDKTTQYKYFASRDAAKEFVASLDSDDNVLIRSTNLEDVFVELTGKSVGGTEMIAFMKQVYYVAWGDMMFLKHNFASILVMSIMSPLLYLIAFGYGLRTGTTDIGTSYVAFVIPGIVALSSMSSSFSSTSTRMNVQRLYYKSFDEMMMCPLSLSAIVLGKCMLGLVRGIISCSLLYALGLFLAPELVLSPLFIACMLVSCLIFSFLGMAAALLAKSHQSMATFNSLIILPMTFLCGTFFSVDSLSPVFQAVLYCLPLTHASECIRASALPDYIPDFPWISLAVLIAFGVAFFVLDWWLLKTRKV